MYSYDLSKLDEERIRKATLDYLLGMEFDKDTSEVIANTGVENLRENIEELINTLNGGDLQKAADVAHTIKGILWNMGLQEEGSLFKKVQLAILDGASEDIVKDLLSKALDAISK
ncbi:MULTISPECIES: Hpt domain-containing protein [unclassified Desulfurobacterium]|uniref:Hpt domain-containing protein n=1 Tax=Desulfurobacterium sp. TC5-1 TaxID=1158318 RepID=UPI0003B6BAD6|nr:Hpt domain-containing protein [Desulfurobacterium sp. TC5-1]